MRLTRFSAALTGTLLAVGVIAGCGSSGSGSATAKGPIHIAMIAPLTGPYTPLGESNVAGAKAAVAQINQAGGIDGRKLVLSVSNDNTDPATSRQLTKSVVDNASNVALIGTAFSSAALADEPLADQAKIPYISMSAAGSQVNPVQPYVWQIPPTSLVAAESIASYLQKAGLTRIGLLHDNGAFPTEGVADVEKIAPKYGLKILANQAFSLSATDFTPQLTALKGSGANAIWLWNVTPQAVTVTKEFRALRLPQTLVLTHGNPTPQYLQPACPADNGAVIASTFAQVAAQLPTTNPSRPLALKVDSLLGPAANQFAYDGYTGVTFLADAMKSGGVSRSGIVKALGNATYVGPEGIYHYSPTNHAGIGTSSIVVERIVNCKLKVVSGQNLAG